MLYYTILYDNNNNTMYNKQAGRQNASQTWRQPGRQEEKAGKQTGGKAYIHTHHQDYQTIQAES